MNMIHRIDSTSGAPALRRSGAPALRLLRAASLLAGLLATAGAAWAQSIPGYVRVVRAVSPPPSTQDGTSWANAYVNPQGALAEARTDPTVTEIWVAAGTYLPTTTSDRTVSFELVAGVDVYGGFQGTETSLNARSASLFTSTILSGDIDGNPSVRTSDSHHVVIAGLGGDYRLDGFKITYGAAIPSISGPALTFPDSAGGGFLATPLGASSDPWQVELRDVTIENCIAEFGGGAFLGASDASNALHRIRISRCTFQNNLASIDGGTITTEGSGGGLTLFWPGDHNQGGGDRYAYLYNNNFANNAAANIGGGVMILNCTSSTHFVNCRFADNTAVAGGAIGSHQNGTANTSYAGGWPLVDFSTFAYNSVVEDDSVPRAGGGAIYVSNHPQATTTPTITVRSCVIWDNVESVGQPTNGSESIGGLGAPYAVVNHSDVQAASTPPVWATGTGNLNTNPLFVNGSTRNLRLKIASPCLDAADDTIIDNTAGLGDVLDINGDGTLGAQHLPGDLDLISREQDAPATADTGIDLAVQDAIADMGCFETDTSSSGSEG